MTDDQQRPEALPQIEPQATSSAGADSAADIPSQNGSPRRSSDDYPKPIAERRKARRAALQILYEVDCTDHKPGIALEYRQGTVQLSDDGLRFLRWLVSGVLANQADLDQLIGRYAPEWPVQQLAIIDRNVLRLSIFELLSPDADAPAKVVINEAVELAKTFGSDSSPRFVNGVLGTALREISSASQADGT